jgi:hypothetical protein
LHFVFHFFIFTNISSRCNSITTDAVCFGESDDGSIYYPSIWCKFLFSNGKSEMDVSTGLQTSEREPRNS